MRATLDNKAVDYTLAIDGMRAVAVIAVIINHLQESLLPSGYLGVDVFFVISGYVITSSLVNRGEESASRFFLGFYKRRIKRLLPALLICVAVATLLISFFNPHPKTHIVTGVSSLFGVSNIALYFKAIEYFGESSRLNPFTHTWSLGVEEQFYMIYPLCVWLAVRGLWDRRRLTMLLGVIVLMSAVSVWSFVEYGKSIEVAVYYLVPFRFWEIGLGCIMFLLMHRGWSGSRFLARYIPPWLLLGGIVGLLFMPRTASVETTVMVVALTALMIVVLRGRDEKSAGFLLTNPVVVYIGTISYSLYLWHWVVISIARWTVGVGWWVVPVLLVLMFAASAASFHLVERPLRHASWRVSRQFRYVLASTVLVGAIVLVPAVLPERAYSLYLGRDADWMSAALSHTDPDILRCTPAGSDAEPQKILSVGNSHARHILPMLELIETSCNVDVSVWDARNSIYVPNGEGAHMDMLESAVDGLHRGDILVLSSRYHNLYANPYLNWNGDVWLIKEPRPDAEMNAALSAWFAELDAVIETAAARGVSVVFFLPNVEFDQRVYPHDSLCVDEWFRAPMPPSSRCNPTVSEEYLEGRFPDEWFAGLAERTRRTDGFFTYDPLPVYCPDGDDCPRIIDGIPAFKDTNHLTEEGSLLMFNDFAAFLNERSLLR